MCPSPLYVAYRFFHGFGCCVFHKFPQPLNELGSVTQVADNLKNYALAEWWALSLALPFTLKM